MAHLSGAEADSAVDGDVRLAELVASMSLATDLGNGQPPETALRCTLAAMRLAEVAGASADERNAVFWGGLLRFVGCLATSVEESAFGGDDLALRAGLLAVDFADPAEVERRVRTSLGEALGAAGAAAATGAFLSAGPAVAPTVFASHCEVASRLATRLGMPARVIDTVNGQHERWDGKGAQGRAGEEIPRAARMIRLAEVAMVYARTLPAEELRASLRRRAGGDLDPELVARLDERPWPVEPAGGSSVWEVVLALEPRPWRRVREDGISELAGVLADYSDLKSPYTLGHARGVATLARAAAEALGLQDGRIRSLELAALLHDLGRASIPNGILDSSSPLNAVDRERARRHSYESERILSMVPALAPIARLAGQAHERLDGSGYHRGLSGSGLSLEARILSAANAYRGLIEGRAHRAAMRPDDAAGELRALAAEGALDRDGVEAVLHAAGDQHAGTARALFPAGLTPREVEVLRLLARGLTNPQIGQALTISPRTAQQHVRHIYEKIGCSTRAGATLFVAEHDLLTGHPRP